ncbi:hypothetical protein E4T66_11065, partial [Sinimarinibacterium sp. CAU 1509]
MRVTSYVVRRWDVLEISGDEDLPHGHFRVVHALVAKNALFLFKLDTDNLMSPPASGVPVRTSYSSVIAGLKAGYISPVDVALPFVMTMPESSIPKSAKDTRDSSWALIEPLVSKSQYPALVSDAEMRQRAIAVRAEALEMQPRALRRLLARYWHFGGKRGLLGLQDRCGAPGKAREAGEVKRGRPKISVATGHDTELIGVNATPEDIRLIEDVSRTKIIQSGWTIQRAYEHLKDDVLVDIEIGRDGQINKSPRPVNRIISSGQFHYYYARFRRRLDVQRALAGKHWDLKLRALKSSARHGIYGPTDRFEIDATVANIWLVSKFDRTKLIGRPVVYLICDTWSRYIVGLHVALEGPSWDTARLAICNALTDKSAFLTAIGMDFPQSSRQSGASQSSLFKGLGTDAAEMAVTSGSIVEDLDV